MNIIWKTFYLKRTAFRFDSANQKIDCGADASILLDASYKLVHHCQSLSTKDLLRNNQRKNLIYFRLIHYRAMHHALVYYLHTMIIRKPSYSYYIIANLKLFCYFLAASHWNNSKIIECILEIIIWAMLMQQIIHSQMLKNTLNIVVCILIWHWIIKSRN